MAKYPIPFLLIPLNMVVPVDFEIPVRKVRLLAGQGFMSSSAEMS
ncbi:hypothetical protein BHOIPH791_05460 [Bartonella henselae]|nr:hypothetical protein Q654_00595 [Bartonella henselae JK 50]ETS09355.1 hypothetical protein Q655_00543 [Bartonella henselae JK 51]CDO39533.1 hypothetical protein PRJBM_00135 [Bartonella henselae]CUH90107.1 hypothetical protein BM1374164_00135 [Bartonella henselae]GFF02415.1 hypothetical protein BH623125_08490 [Bartonella henselae]